MDKLDRKLLNIIQSNFPVAPRPYQVLAEAVGLSEEEVIERVAALKEKGIIRRIGGNVSSQSVGYVSTLCAAKVPKEAFERFVTAVNSRPGVTHNYRRDNELNLWFTLIAPSQESLEAEIAAIERETGVTVINMPAIKTYKIQVDFEM